MDDTSFVEDPPWTLFSDPKPARRVGLAAMLVSLVVCLALTGFGLTAWVLWLVPLLIGLAGAGIAVAIAPRSPGNLALAGVTAGLAFLVALRSEWDVSAPFLFATLALLALAAALLLTMPQVVRRVAVSLFILFHFTGILCAVGSAPPQSWLALTLYESLFRPYLRAVYLTNAYHFYSPEPGPASMLWFRIEYEPDEDGTRYSRWIKLPNMDQDGERLDDLPEGGLRHLPRVEFTRRLSLVENATAPGNVPDARTFGEYKERRYLKGELTKIPAAKNVPLDLQFRPPAPVSRWWLSAYARHVAQTFKHQQRPEKAVVGVKIYRVVHGILSANDWAEGKPFDAPTSYLPYYYGEYEPTGEMKESCHQVVFEANGNMKEEKRDPFLYFLIPIEADPTPQSKGKDYTVKNYLRIHAGDNAEESLP